MKILLDAMGGDNAPNAVLQGAAQAAQEFGQGMTIALLGPAETLKKAAAELSIDLAPFELIDCPRSSQWRTTRSRPPARKRIPA